MNLSVRLYGGFTFQETRFWCLKSASFVCIEWKLKALHIHALFAASLVNTHPLSLYFVRDFFSLLVLPFSLCLLAFSRFLLESRIAGIDRRFAVLASNWQYWRAF